MSQDDVIKILEKAKEPMIVEEIVKELGISKTGTYTNIRKLAKRHLIKSRFRENDRRHRLEYWL